MAEYRYEEKRVDRDLSQLDRQTRKRIFDKIEGVFKPSTPNLRNARRLRGSEEFRLKIGPYRVFYRLDNGCYVIMGIRARKDAYRKKK